MNKILSVIIPMYNSEEYIEKCLDSLILDDEYMQMIEIIVVNDGSTDRSVELVRPYIEKYPETIQLISQENGGHGAAVDAGIDVCQGEYFKVLDADDWFLTNEWQNFIHILREVDAIDVIVSAYERYDIQTQKVQLICSPDGLPVETLLLEQLMRRWMDYRALFALHGLTYRTDFYRSNAVKLPQKVFYDDTLYNIVAASQAKKICVLNRPLYVYRVGDVNQSVSNASRIARISHVETVLRALCRTENLPRSKAGQEYWNYKVRSCITDFLVTAFLRFDDKKAGRLHARTFLRQLWRTNPNVARNVVVRYWAFWGMSVFHIGEDQFDKLLANRN